MDKQIENKKTCNYMKGTRFLQWFDFFPSNISSYAYIIFLLEK